MAGQARQGCCAGYSTPRRQAKVFGRRPSIGRLIRQRHVLAIAALCVLGLSGCTTQLWVVSDKTHFEELMVRNGGDGKRPLEGVIYYLPAVEFDMVVTWKLVSCTQPKIKPSIAVTERYVADRTRPFIVDYKMLRGALKHTDLAVSLYPNGTLKSINGGVEDKTATVVRSVLDLAKSIVAPLNLLSTSHVSPYGNSGPSSVLLPKCTKAAKRALAARTAISVQMTRLRKEIANVSTRNPLRDDDLAILQNLNRKLEIKKVEFTRLLVQTSVKESFNWVPAEVDRTKNFPMRSSGQKKLEQMLTTVPNQPLSIKATIKLAPSPKSMNRDGKKLGIKDSPHNPGKHLIYRAPVPANLVFCHEVCPPMPSCDDRNDDSGIVACKEVQLPQAGLHLALPLVNKGFRKTNLIAEFEENGALRTFRFVSKSQAEELFRALSETAKTASEIVEASKGRDLKELQAETELLKAKAEFIKAERELQALEEGEAVEVE